MSLRKNKSDKRKEPPKAVREEARRTDASGVYCCICLSMSGKDSCRLYPCLHGFCRQCMFDWARVKATCPLCQSEFDCMRFNIINEGVYDEYSPKSMTFYLGSGDETAQRISQGSGDVAYADSDGGNFSTPQ